MNPDTHRQQVLMAWTADSSLASPIVAWTFHDGDDPDVDLPELDHRRGVDLLADGWRLLQMSPSQTRPLGDEYQHGVLEFEWLFERIVDRT